VSGFPIVDLVRSAGGLDALTRVLQPLPVGLPAAVLALQHMPPGHRSESAAILARHTALVVAAATDGAPSEPGAVLVCPPGQHTLVATGETIALIPSGARPPYRPSADLLLATLAVTAGERVIAVVLTGSGTDAATGATAAHRFGGTVIACSPQWSTEQAMPQAVMNRSGVVDHVVALDEVPALLTALITASTTTSPCPATSDSRIPRRYPSPLPGAAPQHTQVYVGKDQSPGRSSVACSVIILPSGSRYRKALPGPAPPEAGLAQGVAPQSHGSPHLIDRAPP
jgi:two-component system chemotaxis response regulator CheB